MVHWFSLGWMPSVAQVVVAVCVCSGAPMKALVAQQEERDRRASRMIHTASCLFTYSSFISFTLWIALIIVSHYICVICHIFYFCIYCDVQFCSIIVCFVPVYTLECFSLPCFDLWKFIDLFSLLFPALQHIPSVKSFGAPSCLSGAVIVPATGHYSFSIYVRPGVPSSSHFILHYHMLFTVLLMGSNVDSSNFYVGFREVIHSGYNAVLWHL